MPSAAGRAQPWATGSCDKVDGFVSESRNRWAPERNESPLQGSSFWERLPPMGLPESATSHPENQERGRRCRRKPRPRRCLLKGCEQKYRPSHARQRYCSAACQQAAKAWKRRKSQQKYRATARGKEKRQSQSQRYRERVGHRQARAEEAVGDVARVIPKKFF